MAILPLALTMMAGHQILSAIIFVTAPKPLRLSGSVLPAGKTAIKAGGLMIWLMPGDIIAMLTIGFNVVQDSAGPLATLPFVAVTLLIAALPVLVYLTFGSRAWEFMPESRDWMNAHRSQVGHKRRGLCFVFVALILS